MSKYVSTDDGETFHLDFDDKGREMRIEIGRAELKRLVNEAAILLEITQESGNSVDTEDVQEFSALFLVVFQQLYILNQPPASLAVLL